MQNAQALNSKKLKNNSNYGDKVSGAGVLREPDPKGGGPAEGAETEAEGAGGEGEEEGRKRQEAAGVH